MESAVETKFSFAGETRTADFPFRDTDLVKSTNAR